MRVPLILLALAGTATADVQPRHNVVRVEHRPADDNPTLGGTSAPVTAELFFVPGQVESNRAYKRVLELYARHPRRLRVIFRVITRQAAVVVPIVALEAFAEGKFEDFMDVILGARSGAVRRDDLPALTEAAGLDPERVATALDRALDPDLYPAALAANENRRARQGTNIPELLFNGTQVGQTLTSLDVDDLDAEYHAAYDEAQVLLADGVPIAHLVEAVERNADPGYALGGYPAGPIDDPEPELELPEGVPPLLDHPLDLDGLPTDGDAGAPVEVVLLCNLRYVSCRSQLDSVARRLRDLYPDEVRLVWAPWFDLDVAGNETAPRLHAAALCAERQGAGWKWIDETLRQVFRGVGEGNGDVDTLIDAVAKLAEVDDDALRDCLDTMTDDEVIARVEAAKAAGVTHAPALVIGGRAYAGGFTDWRAAKPVIDTELAPGLLEQLAPSW